MKGAHYLVAIAIIGLTLGIAPAAADDGPSEASASSGSGGACPDCICPTELPVWFKDPEDAIDQCTKLVLH